jgi:hypothetical protein
MAKTRIKIADPTLQSSAEQDKGSKAQESPERAQPYHIFPNLLANSPNREPIEQNGIFISQGEWEGNKTSTSTVQMKKSSGSGARPRPISLLPGADFARVLGAQKQTTEILWRDTAAAVAATQPVGRSAPVPTSADLTHRRRT